MNENITVTLDADKKQTSILSDIQYTVQINFETTDISDAILYPIIPENVLFIENSMVMNNKTLISGDPISGFRLPELRANKYFISYIVYIPDLGEQTCITGQVKICHGEKEIYSNKTETFIEYTPPVAPDYDAATTVGSPISGTIAAKTENCLPLFFSIVSSPVHGQASIDKNGLWTYVPHLDFAGSDNFVVKITDKRGQTATSKVTVTIWETSIPPKQTEYTAEINENQHAAGQIEISGMHSKARLLCEPAVGKAVVEPDGKWFYQPPPGFTGTCSFQAKIETKSTSAYVVTITVLVKPSARPVVVDNYKYFTLLNKPIDGEIVPKDHNFCYTFTVKDKPAHGHLLFIPNGCWRYYPHPDYSGTDTFLVSVENETGAKAESRVNIDIIKCHAKKTIPAMTLINTPLHGILPCYEATIPRLSISKPPRHGVAHLKHDKWEYTPFKSYCGHDCFIIRAEYEQNCSVFYEIDIKIGKPKYSTHQNGLTVMKTKKFCRWKKNALHIASLNLEYNISTLLTAHGTVRFAGYYAVHLEYTQNAQTHTVRYVIPFADYIKNPQYLDRENLNVTLSDIKVEHYFKKQFVCFEIVATANVSNLKV